MNSFFPIRIDEIKDNTSAHFDIYADIEQRNKRLNLTPDLLLYAKAPYDWTRREIEQLIASGISTLYVREDDRNRYVRYQRVNTPIPEIDYSQPSTARIKQIEEVGAHLIETAFLTDVSDELLGKLKIVADDLTDCITENPRSVLELKSLADYDLYTYVHSVGVASLTTAIALAVGISKPSDLREYAFGGLLHDIGKKFVPLHVLNKAGPLTPEEWETMKKHPEDGATSVETFDIPDRCLDIIRLHHEKLDGSGYPNGLTKPNIPVHVQIATVADIYNALTTTRCYHRRRSRFEALMFMKHNLQGKISPEIFGALVQSLANEEQARSSSKKGI